MKLRPSIGFVGLGLMGLPMAQNLIKAGFPLVVYDRSEKRKHLLDERCIVSVKSPYELNSLVDIVITMVPRGPDVQNILFGKDGIVHGSEHPKLIIDMSTIGPSYAKTIAFDLQTHDIAFLDAPVTGTVPKATDGTLTIFVGGEPQMFDYALPVFEAMGKNIRYMGPAGSGQSMKLVNNYIITSSVVGLAEAMIFAEEMGMDRREVGDVLKSVPCMSEHMKFKIDNFVNDSFPLFFSVRNKLKDMKLTQDEAKKHDLNLESLDYLTELYQDATEQGLDSEDMSIIFKMLQKKQKREKNE